MHGRVWLGLVIPGTLLALLYCHASAVSRGQMAAFLVKTFGLVLYGP